MTPISKTPILSIEFDPPKAYLWDLEVLPTHVFKDRLKDTVLHTQRPLFYMMFVVQSGVFIHWVDGVRYQCKAHDGLLIKPNQIHQFLQPINWDGWVLIFHPNLLLSNSKEEEILYQLPTSFSMSQRLLSTSILQLQSMREDSHLNAPKHEINTLLRYQLSSLIWRLYLDDQICSFDIDSNEINAIRFKRFRHLLENHFQKEHQASFYAHIMGISNKTLHRLCLQMVNVTAKSLITERILLEAKRLLMHTNLPIQAIGDTLSFDETSNFVKLFKKHAQVTPKQFRLQHQMANTLHQESPP